MEVVLLQCLQLSLVSPLPGGIVQHPLLRSRSRARSNCMKMATIKQATRFSPHIYYYNTSYRSTQTFFGLLLTHTLCVYSTWLAESAFLYYKLHCQHKSNQRINKQQTRFCVYWFFDLPESFREGDTDMGCDGGTIPRRDEMVKLKKKAEKVTKCISLCILKIDPINSPRLTKMLSWPPGGSTVPSLQRI